MARFSRERAPDGHAHASPLELFYDLVFVFAITQVSHYLLEHLSWEGAGQAAVILIAVWWSWNFTTWATNELDTSAAPVKVMVIAVMLGSLLMAVAIPEAWGEQALLFAGAYVAIQVGRHSFMAFAVGTKGSLERLRAEQIVIWFIFSGIFWIAGALADEGTPRTVLWLIAVSIDLLEPVFVFRVPWLPKLGHEAWVVTSDHFAERFQLFVIIALGESIVITGATTSDLDLTTTVVLAFAMAFVATASLWWIYFNRAAELMQGMLEKASDQRTLLARDIYTYMHALVIAGVILVAVGDEIVIAHPTDPLHGDELLVLVAGPALYLMTLSLIRLRTAGTLSPKRTIAALACVAVGLLARDAEAIVVAGLLTAVLIALVVAEEFNFDRAGWRVSVERR
ncbi:MAG: low temperature requirement protein A [Solirubrobacterales bacterium]|nr:low temperature requirement protein A [Solirubrobacterales bacterium]